MNILLTGVSGFVGSNVARQIIQNRPEKIEKRLLELNNETFSAVYCINRARDIVTKCGIQNAMQ